MTKMPFSPNQTSATDPHTPAPSVNVGLTLALFVVLFAFWLLLSGHGEAWLLGLGVASCAVTTWLAQRLGLIDREGMPLHILPATLAYLPWLVVEIVKANIDVARAILSGQVEPSVFRTHASQKTDLGRVVYANSITLTPGTVTVGIEPGGVFVVHALTRGSREGVEAGEMDARVARLMGDA